MAFNRFLHTTGCKFSHFVAPTSYTTIEWSMSDGSSSGRREKLNIEDLGSWLKQPVPPNSLKLLVHQWEPWKHGDSHDLYDPSSNLVFPAKDKNHFAWIANQMKLPESFILNFSRRQATPLNVTRGKDDTLEIICQTPDYSNSFSSLALSHDPRQQTTIGILCFTAGSMSKLNDLIFEVAEHAGAPLFIPALIFWIFASMQRRQLRDIHNIMALVQRDTTLLDQFLKTSDSNASMARQAKFDDIHSLLTQQHARLTSGLTEFVGDLGVALDRGLDRIQTILGNWKLSMDPDVHKDFQKYVWQLRREAEAALQHRDRLLSRIDLQLKVLYNLMQQRIAQEAKSDSDLMRTIADAARRDSLEMKGIAWLTMTFLPMTALASVFSMSSFFIDYNGGSNLEISPQFWIFWAVTAPVTILILIGWNVWKEWLCQIENRETPVRRPPFKAQRSFADYLPFGIPLSPVHQKRIVTDQGPYASPLRLTHSSTTPLTPKYFVEGEERVLPGHNEIVRPPTGYAVYPGGARPFELP